VQEEEKERYGIEIHLLIEKIIGELETGKPYIYMYLEERVGDFTERIST
jgi:hypothetical protein